MDFDSITNKLKVKNIIIVILVLLIILLLSISTYLYINNINLKNENNKIKNTNKPLTEEESINKGTNLYNKVNDIYEVYSYDIPYCGLTYNEIQNQELTNFEDELKDTSDNLVKDEEVKNDIYYYKSHYKNLKELKNYLSNYLSNDLINKKIKIKEKEITDISMLNNSTYHGSNYVIKNNNLYCKATTKKKNNSRYINYFNNNIDPYDIRVLQIDNDRINYLINSKYLNDNIKDFNSECTNNIEKCINTNEKSFVIEKNDNKWIVSVFNYHK